MGTLPRNGEVSVEVDASPEQVWNLLTDITRAGEWSHETQGGDWLDDATAAAPGARFQGRNENGRFKWTRQCEVLSVEQNRSISWRTIPTKLRYRDSTIWTYELEPTGRGCRITQRFEVVQLGPLTDRLFYAVIPAHRDRSDALADDVRRLGEHAATVAVA
ncbi:MAG: SRPBCC family protein [Acidimicrobiales bacterium]